MVFVKRLIQLDVDSTFIQQEAIELLAAKANVLAQVSAITESAMRGELDFEQSLRARVLLLKGLPESVIVQVQNEISLTDGAEELVNTLHAKGHSVALVSGGFIDIIAPMIQDLSIKYYKANKLEIVDGVLTGGLMGPIIDRSAKAVALKEFATTSGVAIENTVANDLDMMATAGLSIAFNAKPVVVEAADLAINEPSLRSVIDLIQLQ
jgi:phosphoserine phosphatase